jgi:hypothetical protein
MACLGKCANDDLVCQLSCQAGHDKGSQELQEVGSCAQTKCPNECPSDIGDGGLGDGF